MLKLHIIFNGAVEFHTALTAFMLSSANRYVVWSYGTLYQNFSFDVSIALLKISLRF